MFKKSNIIVVAGAAAAAMMATPAAGAVDAVDVASRIESRVPVPGGFTAGSWNISNQGTTTVPAGSTYLVTFSQLDGSLTPSSLTLTRWKGSTSITKLSANQFRITVNSDLRAGQEVSGVWSDSHVFNTYLRDKVVIELESTPGATDVNSANDAFVFDNAGQGI